MDQKISEMGVATAVLATDLIPIVSNGGNLAVTAGVFKSSLGNIGIDASTPVAPSGVSIPLTASLVTISIPANYTIATGTNGQQITIVNTAASNASLTFGINIAEINPSGSVTLVYIGSKWFVKSAYFTTIE